MRFKIINQYYFNNFNAMYEDILYIKLIYLKLESDIYNMEAFVKKVPKANTNNIKNKFRKITSGINDLQEKEDNITKEVYARVASQLGINISKDVVDTIYESLCEYRTNNQIKRILYTWKYKKDPTYNPANLLIDPFAFINFDVQLISFEKAEKIRIDKGIETNIDTHTQAWIAHYFLTHPFDKAFYIEKWKVENRYLEAFRKIHGATMTTKHLVSKLKTKNINGKTYYTTEYFVSLERELGDDILDMFYSYDDNNNETKDNLDMITFVEQWEHKNFKLTSEQKECIQDGFDRKLHIITGYPGTGKSTILDIIIDYKVHKQRISGDRIFNLAPTGLAMKNMMKKCGKHINPNNGMTLHKFMSYIRNLETDIRDGKVKYVDSGQYKKSYKTHEKTLFTPTHINVDETSMVDFFKFRELIEVCKNYNCTLTLIGDCNQLSPVGIGSPFSDIIDSELFAVNELTDIKRQSGSLSDNIKAMHKRKITKKDFDGESMLFIETNDFSNKNIRSIVSEHAPTNRAVIVSQSKKDTPIGWDTLNNTIQHLVNPLGERIIKGYDKEIRKGDTVIRTENDYGEDCVRVNGDVGVIDSVDRDSRSVTIGYLDGTEDETVSFKHLNELFELFYASTVHKMQGAEKDNIVLVIHPEHKYMWSKNQDKKKLLYTAISRAKQKCIIIGGYQLFLKAQDPLTSNQKPIGVFMREFERNNFV